MDNAIEISVLTWIYCFVLSMRLFS